MKNVEVGMFRLPGITFPKDVGPDIIEEMISWAKENHCGTCMGPGFWSFRNEAQRDWFILRWIDHIPKEEEKKQ
jgi:hypothetical protein